MNPQPPLQTPIDSVKLRKVMLNCLSYLFYLGSELILIDVRKFYRPSVPSVATATPSIRHSLEVSVLVSQFDTITRSNMVELAIWLLSECSSAARVGSTVPLPQGIWLSTEYGEGTDDGRRGKIQHILEGSERMDVCSRLPLSFVK